MAEMLAIVKGRSKVMLRVPLSESARAAAAMDLPTEPLTASRPDPWILWLAPEQWLITSDYESADTLIARCREALGSLVHSATDASAALTCLRLEHPQAGGLLAMGSGLDYDRLSPGQCARTRLARVPVVIVPLRTEIYELYVDRSYARYLYDWIVLSASDPVWEMAS